MDVFFYPDYASLSAVRQLGGRRALRSLNDTAHLTGSYAAWPAHR
jgi:hypothetical protein